MMAFQSFPGGNFGNFERAPHWVLRTWVQRHAAALGLDPNVLDRSTGVFSHAFVASADALTRLAARSIFGARLCSKFQDQGAERLLGAAADQLLAPSHSQARCTIDGPLYQDGHHACCTAAQMETSRTGFDGQGITMEKVAHSMLHLNAFSGGAGVDNRTLWLPKTGLVYWSALQQRLNASCGHKLQALRTPSPPEPPSLPTPTTYAAHATRVATAATAATATAFNGTRATGAPSSWRSIHAAAVCPRRRARGFMTVTNYRVLEADN